MEGFQDLILPQTTEHILLLNILLLINLIVFIPYLSILWGNLLISVYCRNFCETGSTRKFVSQELIMFLNDKRFYGYVFSIFPALGLLTIFSQLLSEAETSVYPLFIWTSILLFAGQIFTFRFQSSMGKENPDIGKGNLLYLWAAVILVSFGVWAILSAYDGIINISGFIGDTSFISYLISFSTLSRIAVYFVLSLAISSSFGIFRLYHAKNVDQDLREKGVKVLAKTALINIVILPVWAIISFMIMPAIALSQGVFLFLSFTVFMAIALAILYYGLSAEPDSKGGISAFYLFIIALAFVFSADHLIIHNATSPVTEKLYAKAELLEAEKVDSHSSTLTVEEQLALGENIYNTICFACHQFDSRLVGPPYNEILPKYIDSPDKMKNYILNPVKIREDYPPMPAQPLKPQEADAVVMYLLKMVKEKK